MICNLFLGCQGFGELYGSPLGPKPASRRKRRQSLRPWPESLLYPRSINRNMKMDSRLQRRPVPDRRCNLPNRIWQIGRGRKNAILFFRAQINLRVFGGFRSGAALTCGYEPRRHPTPLARPPLCRAFKF